MALVSMLFSVQVSAADTKVALEPGALTAAPPVSENIQSFSISPSFKYLYEANLGITTSSGLKVRLNATTMAYGIVDSLGANVSLERYNGSIWVAVGTTSALSAVSTDYYSGNADYVVTSGYYYRGKGTHWARQGTLREEATIYSPTVLVTQ